MYSILSLLLFISFFGTIIVIFSRSSYAYLIGLYTSILVFFLSIFLLFKFDPNFQGFQFYYSYFYPFSLGVDGLSLFFILLTTFIFPLCILSSTASIYFNHKLFILIILAIEFFLIASFTVLDLFYFFFFFEAILVPMYLLIIIWGSRTRKIKASFYFFFYTLILSAFLFIAIILIFKEVGSTAYFNILYYDFENDFKLSLAILMFIAFAGKVPIVPFHVWLPEAHVEAPTSGSVILASLLLKLGSYGFLRFYIPIFSDLSATIWPYICLVSGLSCVYCSLLALQQIDLKKIIAYSSIAHMNLGILGIFSGSLFGAHGGLLLFISHGLVSGGLFFCIGIMYDRYHTRSLFYYSGLAQLMPIFSFFFLFFMFSNIAFPGTLGFVSEFLVLLGIYLEDPEFGFFVGAATIILTLVYSISSATRVCFGPIKPLYIVYFVDLTFREYFVLFPLFFFVLVLGFSADFILDYTYLSLLFLY